MTVAWSFHAKSQRAAILRTIARRLSRNDASRWNRKFHDAVLRLPDFPEMGSRIPDACFATVPQNANRLRQMRCNPYRIVYEVQGDQIHILAIMHSRMLVRAYDTH